MHKELLPVTPQPPRLVVQATGDRTVVRFAGRTVALHDHTVALLRDRLVTLADGPEPETLLLDFGNDAMIRAGPSPLPDTSPRATATCPGAASNRS
jgi:hypothetical protein